MFIRELLGRDLAAGDIIALPSSADNVRLGIINSINATSYTGPGQGAAVVDAVVLRIRHWLPGSQQIKFKKQRGAYLKTVVKISLEEVALQPSEYYPAELREHYINSAISIKNGTFTLNKKKK